MTEKKTILQLARERRSVRTYKDEPLSEEMLSNIRSHVASIHEPFGGRVSFRLLDARTHHLSSPVIKGASQYLAICARKGENADLAAGYAGEDLVLYLTGIGVGTVWIGGTMDRDAFEKAAGIKEDEVMTAVTPLGIPADRMSLRESLMRKGVKADERLKTEEIYSERSVRNIALDRETYCEAVEAVRLAPSAVNHQPWRIIHDDAGFHFFLKRSLKASGSPDMQKTDMGIALYHFCAVLDEKGQKYRIEKLPDRQEADMEYIISVVPA